jgi:membrane protein required for colicin V production
MSAVDITILSIVAISTGLGFYWGFIRQVVAVVGLAGGIFAAGRYYASVAEILHPAEGGGLIADENWARIIAFVAIVILVSVALGVVGSALRLLVKLLFIGCIDRALGGLLGFVMSVMLVVAFVVVVTVFPVPGLSEALQTSRVAQQLSGFVPVVLAFLPPEFQQYFALAKLVELGLP